MAQRSSIGVAVAAALLVGTTVGTAVGVTIGRDGGGAAPPTTRGGAPGEGSDQATPAADLALVAHGLTRPGSCDTLLEAYVERGAELVGPWGWGLGPVLLEVGDFAGMPGVAARDSAVESQAGTVRSTNGPTGTNVQETGVDEPDVVKTDGETLWRVDDGDLLAYDVSGDAAGPAPEELSALELDGLRDAEILLAGDRVVALGPDSTDGHRLTRVVVVDVADPGAPQVVDSQALGGTLTAARLHGAADGGDGGDGGDGVVRAVVSTGPPDLPFVHPTRRRSESEARQVNRALVRSTTLDDWLPTRQRAGSTDPLVECGDVAVPDDDRGGLGTMTVVALDPSDPTTASVDAVMTGSETAYFSADRFYLASGAPQWDCCWGEPVVPHDWWPGGRDSGTTALFAFALDGLDTRYVASGEVEGAVRDRWAMDSVDGVLRVAVGETRDTGPFSSVVTLAEQDGELVEVGRVDRLGVGEDLKAVRWFDDLAIVVTFRQVDPLHAVDLTDPSRPRLLGELEIPGFSEYLHPLGPRRLIGVGQDASRDGRTRGAQAALFDVTDLTDVRRLDTVAYPRRSQAGAGADPRQFTWLPDRRTALTVVSRGWEGRTGWVSVLELGGGRMTDRLVEVEYGREIEEVRLVPLPSGAVVLVTGDGVEFFDL